MVVIGLLLLLVGGFIFFQAGRGRVVGDHPHCRACGRDLYGLEHPAKCPECGKRLWSTEIEYGRRVASVRGLWLGGLLAVPGLAMLIAGSAGFDPYRRLPTWALALDLTDGSSAEVLRRVAAGELSDEQAARFVADYLDDQADPSQRWVRHKGQLIIDRAVAGDLSAADEFRFFEQTFGEIIDVREQVREGTSLRVIFGGDVRVGTSLRGHGRGWWIAVIRDGLLVQVEKLSSWSGGSSSASPENTFSAKEFLDLTNLPPGRYGVGIVPPHLVPATSLPNGMNLGTDPLAGRLDPPVPLPIPVLAEFEIVADD